MTDQTKPLMLYRGHMKGTVEASPGLRVALMIKGDRQGYKCYERRVEGVIEDFGPSIIGLAEVVVRFDQPQPYVGERIRTWAAEVTVLD